MTGRDLRARVDAWGEPTRAASPEDAAMGEYAKYAGKEIKIGTCEEMYYLRFDQRHDVIPMAGSLDPTDADALKVIRFRFPFPDEDGTPPGGFDRYNRYVHVTGATIPAGVEHFGVQFKAAEGYLLSLPCPEGSGFPGGLKVWKNGWRGDVLLVQQAMRGGWLAPVFMCGGCGAKWSEPDPEAARRMFAPMLAYAERCEAVGDSRALYVREIVRRALAGAPAAVAS